MGIFHGIILGYCSSLGQQPRFLGVLFVSIEKMTVNQWILGAGPDFQTNRVHYWIRHLHLQIVADMICLVLGYITCSLNSELIDSALGRVQIAWQLRFSVKPMISSRQMYPGFTIHSNPSHLSLKLAHLQRWTGGPWAYWPLSSCAPENRWC